MKGFSAIAPSLLHHLVTPKIYQATVPPRCPPSRMPVRRQLEPLLTSFSWPALSSHGTRWTTTSRDCTPGLGSGFLLRVFNPISLVFTTRKLASDPIPVPFGTAACSPPQFQPPREDWEIEPRLGGSRYASPEFVQSPSSPLVFPIFSLEFVKRMLDCPRSERWLICEPHPRRVEFYPPPPMVSHPTTRDVISHPWEVEAGWMGRIKVPVFSLMDTCFLGCVISPLVGDLRVPECTSP